MNLLKEMKPIHIAIFSFILMLCAVVWYATTNRDSNITWLFGENSEPDVTEPPLPPVPEYQKSIVKVANRIGNATFNGYGLAVEYKGTEFILASRMLFLDAGEVTVDGKAASVFAANPQSDLVALHVYMVDFPCVELVPDDSKGSFILAADTNYPVTFVEADLRETWVALQGVPYETVVEGAPVFKDETLVGLMLGYSKSGIAIAANNDALIAFGEQILTEKSR